MTDQLGWGAFVLVRDVTKKTQDVEWYRTRGRVLYHYDIGSVLGEVQRAYNKPDIESAIIDIDKFDDEAELAVELERLRVMWRKRRWD